MNLLENIFSDFGLYSGDNQISPLNNEPNREEREVHIDNNQNLPVNEDIMKENKLDE